MRMMVRRAGDLPRASHPHRDPRFDAIAGAHRLDSRVRGSDAVVGFVGESGDAVSAAFGTAMSPRPDVTLAKARVQSVTCGSRTGPRPFQRIAAQAKNRIRKSTAGS